MDANEIGYEAVRADTDKPSVPVAPWMSPAAVPKGSTEMLKLVQRYQALNKQLGSVKERLTSALDRLHGPRPEPISPGSPKSGAPEDPHFQTPMTATLNKEAEVMESLTRFLADQCERIEQIV